MTKELDAQRTERRLGAGPYTQGQEKPLYLELLGPGAVPVGQPHPLDKEFSL